MRLPVLTTFLILTLTKAGACPDCALQGTGGQIEPQTIASKLAFSVSTLLLLGILFSVIAFLVWMMVRTCAELARERPLTPDVTRI
jgi:hypothetical protein